MGNWRLFLIGQLYARADVCSEVSLAADQQDPCAGAEVLDLGFPLPQQVKINDQMTSFLKFTSSRLQ